MHPSAAASSTFSRSLISSAGSVSRSISLAITSLEALISREKTKNAQKLKEHKKIKGFHSKFDSFVSKIFSHIKARFSSTLGTNELRLSSFSFFKTFVNLS